MTRSRILLTLFISYFSVLILLGLWTGQAWSASNPDISLAVKGASTDPDILQSSPLSSPQLAAYPSLPSSFPTINAREYALYNPESGKVLIQSKTMQPVPIASTTKLMTTYLAVKYLPLDEVVDVSPEAANVGGSLMQLRSHEKMTVQNLLYGALLVSGNDAAFALAQTTGGKLLNNPNASSAQKIDRFVQEMNKQATDFYMLQTKYQDPVGLNDQGHSTAIDLAKLTSFVNENPVLKQIIATSDLTVYDQDRLYRHDLHNSNHLLADEPYPGVLGGKTGFTDAAGHCLITSVRRNGLTLIAVVLHTDQDNAEASAQESRKLLDTGFSSITWQ